VVQSIIMYVVFTSKGTQITC